MSMSAEQNEDIIPEPVETVPCALCGRKFLAERLEKHQKICNKTQESKKKRKIFNSVKQRADLEQINGFPVTPPSRITTASKEDKKPNKTSNWRAKHEEFLRTVRQARGEKVEEPATNGDSGVRVPVGYIMCQFCGRNFSDKAADRHIEWCKEQKRRIPSSRNNNTKALERMKARTQYKPASKKSSPKTETPPKPIGGSRSQPPTPPNNRKVTHLNGKPSPPSSLPIQQSNGLKSKTSPKTTVPNQRSTPSPPTKSKFNKQRINSLSRPKNLSPNSIEHLMKQTEPVMKFKEKFPNHTIRDTNFVKNEQLKELLKKTEAYCGGPRTVPGVRTGGMSPIKTDNHIYNNSHQNGHYNNSHQISEDEELEKLKSKIEELYLNGSTKYKPNSLQNNTNNNKNNNNSGNNPVSNGLVTNGTHNNKKNIFEINSESTTRGSTSGSSAESSSSIRTPPRDNSASDGTRSQASSTTSSGLPKFCHQCGTKYPTTIAKYCYECGSRRLGTVGPFLANLD